MKASRAEKVPSSCEKMSIDVTSADNFEVVKRSTYFNNLTVDQHPSGREAEDGTVLVGHLLFFLSGKNRRTYLPIIHILDLINLEWFAEEVPDLLGDKCYYTFLANDAVYFAPTYTPTYGVPHLVFDLVSRELEEFPTEDELPELEYSDTTNGGYIESLNEYVVFCGKETDPFGEDREKVNREIVCFSVESRSWRQALVKGKGPSGRFNEESSCVNGKSRIYLLVCGIGFEKNTFYTLDCQIGAFYWSKLNWKNPWFYSNLHLVRAGRRVFVYGGEKMTETEPEFCMWDLHTNERHTIFSKFGGVKARSLSRLKGSLPPCDSNEMVFSQGRLYFINTESHVVHVLSGSE